MPIEAILSRFQIIDENQKEFKKVKRIQKN